MLIVPGFPISIIRSLSFAQFQIDSCVNLCLTYWFSNCRMSFAWHAVSVISLYCHVINTLVTKKQKLPTRIFFKNVFLSLHCCVDQKTGIELEEKPHPRGPISKFIMLSLVGAFTAAIQPFSLNVGNKTTFCFPKQIYYTIASFYLSL